MFLTFLAGALAAPPSRKFLAGPPSEFVGRVLPEPRLRTSRSIRYDLSADGNTYSREIHADVSTLIITFAAPGAKTASFSLISPTGQSVPLPAASFDPVPLGTHQLEAASFALANVSVGSYIFSATLSAASAAAPVGRLTVYSHEGVALTARLSSFANLRTGKNASVTAQLVDHKGARLAYAPGSVIADLDVMMPDGTQEELPMHDDGRHGDGLAGDGTFGASFALPTPGDYVTRAHFRVLNGVKMSRTTSMVVPVSPITSAAFVGTARARAVDGHALCTPALTPRCGARTAIDIDVSAPLGAEVYVYGEVWGVGVGGDKVPVAWVQTLADVVAGTGKNGVVTVEVDGAWLVKAQATPPLELRNVRLQCAGSSVPVATTASGAVIPVADPAGAAAAATHVARTVPHSEAEARSGVCPAHICGRRFNASAHKLVLVHGYCSDGTTWPTGDFPEGIFFNDPNQNRGNLEFAKLVLDFASTNGAESIALIGHSQGGPVSTTVHASYWSGLDAPALSGRLIQSVGSPYLGCSAAGSLADLGSGFGVGCGANSDLDPDGAALWLATVPAATRANVHYYSTTYKKGNLFGDSCSLPMNSVLEWPNDGVTEEINSDLPGDVDMGNKEKWCHTTGMNYPAQYTDSTRNAEMLAAAAKPSARR